MSKPDPNHLHWLETILTEALDELNEWETNFINDIAIRLWHGNTLTSAQAEKLEQIYVSKTS